MIIRFKNFEMELSIEEYKKLIDMSCEPRELPSNRKHRGRPRKIKKEKITKGRRGMTQDDLTHIKYIKELIQTNPEIKDKEIIRKLKERFDIEYTRDKVRYWRKTTPKELVM